MDRAGVPSIEELGRISSFWEYQRKVRQSEFGRHAGPGVNVSLAELACESRESYFNCLELEAALNS